MKVTSQLRGHKIEYDLEKKEWIYCDTMESTVETHKERPCAKCNEMATKEGHDACISNLPGVLNACCGHGDTGYIQFENGVIIRGKFNIEKQ